MILIQKILGNIRMDANLNKKYLQMQHENKCEFVKITRFESQRNKMRKNSNLKTDIAIELPKELHFHNGDVLFLDENKMILIEIEPEDVMMVEIKKNLNFIENIHIPIKIGHSIGNLHRPIKIQDNKIYFPIQSDSEIDTFHNIFSSLNEHLIISKTKILFEPDEEFIVHEH